VTAKGPALEIPAALLERLPDELRERIRGDWRAVLEERKTAAVDWRWVANPTGDEDLSPHSVERMGYGPGRRRRLPAPEGRELTLYGYDADGRTLVSIERDPTGADDTYGLLWHDEAESLALHVQAPRGPWPAQLLAAWRSRNVDGQPVTSEHLGAEGGSVEQCRWDGDRVVEVRHEYRGREWNLSYRDVVEWQGPKLLRIERHWKDGPVELKFERMPSAVKLEAIVAQLEDELVERIPSVAAEAFGRGGRICAVALGYCDGENSLPPQLVACPEAVRRQLLDEHEDDFWYRWQAAEWMSAADVPELVVYGDPDFKARCEQVDRQVRLGGDERVTGRLLQAVARRLNELDWHGRLDVTEDFLVYPWEVHGEALEADIAASAPRPGRRSR
jgi:hypothetical protein